MEQALFYNNVTLLDFAYITSDLKIVGESYRVDVELVGELDSEQMIFDFSKSKKLIKEIIDKECDHRLVVYSEMVEESGSIAKIEKQGIFYKAPIEAFCLVPFSRFSIDELRTFLEKLLMSQMPSNVLDVRVNLTPDHSYHKKFHYTHGLKDHYGNCQRLIHGHRSSVEIYIDGLRKRELEERFIETFLKGSVHFVFVDNLVEESIKSREEGFLVDVPLVHIRYRSGQGEFEAKIPGYEVYLLKSETTVENLAIHFLRLSAHIVDKKSTVTLKAFEGIGKGGKASSTF